MLFTVFLLNSAPPDSVRTVVTMNSYMKLQRGDITWRLPKPSTAECFPSSRKNDAIILPQKTNFCSLCTGKCGCCYGSVAIWSCCYSLVFNQIHTSIALYYHAIAKLFFHKKNAVYFLIWKHVFFVYLYLSTMFIQL